MGMSEIKPTQGNIVPADKQAPEMGWRQGVLGVGVLLLVVSLFVSAGAKGALGRPPLVLACVAIVLIIVPAVAGVIEWLSSKKGGGKDTSV
jgi:hypothetical protein